MSPVMKKWSPKMLMAGMAVGGVGVGLAVGLGLRTKPDAQDEVVRQEPAPVQPPAPTPEPKPKEKEKDAVLPPPIKDPPMIVAPGPAPKGIDVPPMPKPPDPLPRSLGRRRSGSSPCGRKSIGWRPSLPRPTTILRCRSRTRMREN